ncbi:MAG TPA: hypothetical protein PK771_16290, partial [Spirochaetota bacterium]|nr:hypothetical protein [Spirochaetota bacterium]
MEYKEIRAATLKDAQTIIKKEYGDKARILKTDYRYEGGFLGFGRKKSVIVKISIAGADLLDIYRKNLGIEKVKKDENSLEKDINKFAREINKLSNKW